MRIRVLVLPIAFFLVALAGPAFADLTVVTRYTLVNGDTLVRSCYYTRTRLRVTSPDGKEFMFNSKSDSITVIDHQTMTYWTGPRALADSVAIKVMTRNDADIPARDPVELGNKMQAFNDSIKVGPTGKQRKIAGYPCDQWLVTAGRFLTSERWIARSLSVPNYGPEMQKVVVATIKDPLGRALMRMAMGVRAADGLILSGRTSFQTMNRTGSFEFEAQKVITKPIPKSAWSVPAGYHQIAL